MCDTALLARFALCKGERGGPDAGGAFGDGAAVSGSACGVGRCDGDGGGVTPLAVLDAVSKEPTVENAELFDTRHQVEF